MMITVWGRASSSNVQPVMWTIAELGLEHRRIDAGFTYSRLDAPEFLALNPHGMIPVIRDGDEPPIWESWAIVRYLAARHGEGTLWEPEPGPRARIEMWADWVKLHVSRELTGGVFQPLVRTPPEKRDMAAIERAIAGVGRSLARVERRLEEVPWLSGARFGVADIMLGHLLYRWYDMEIERPALPRLDAYYGRLTERPAYREHVMVSYEELRA